MSKTYLFAKIGKSIKFNPNSWSGIGGDVEVPSLIRAFARNNPNDNIIIIGKNDLDKNDIPEKNIYSIKTLYEKKFDKYDYKNYTISYKVLKDTKIDGVFVFSGPAGSTNIPNLSYIRKDFEKGIKKFTNPLTQYIKYVADIFYFLNNTNVPWVYILNDPRYKQVGRDLINMPKTCLSQYNETYNYNTLDNFENQNSIKHPIKCIYAGVEKMFLSHFKDFNDKGIEKDIKFLIVLNEGKNGVKSRYGELKKFVLDYFDDVSIYGDWKKETIKDDKRFKGAIPFIELQKLIPRVKYSFIIPITKGWVTMKFWEMVVNGIIPFMHPEYDTQNNLNAPEFLRIKNGKELKEKIDYLENNPNEYNKLLNQLRNMIAHDDFSGKSLSDTLINTAKELDYETYNKNKIEFNIKNFENSLSSLF